MFYIGDTATEFGGCNELEVFLTCTQCGFLVLQITDRALRWQIRFWNLFLPSLPLWPSPKAVVEAIANNQALF
jgi:hypothetical protein